MTNVNNVYFLSIHSGILPARQFFRCKNVLKSKVRVGIRCFKNVVPPPPFLVVVIYIRMKNIQKEKSSLNKRILSFWNEGDQSRVHGKGVREFFPTFLDKNLRYKILEILY